jgi:hypothetical protein
LVNQADGIIFSREGVFFRAIEVFSLVMAGLSGSSFTGPSTSLVPAIHVFFSRSTRKRGWPARSPGITNPHALTKNENHDSIQTAAGK